MKISPEKNLIKKKLYFVEFIIIIIAVTFKNIANPKKILFLKQNIISFFYYYYSFFQCCFSFQSSVFKEQWKYVIQTGCGESVLIRPLIFSGVMILVGA